MYFTVKRVHDIENACETTYACKIIQLKYYGFQIILDETNALFYRIALLLWILLSPNLKFLTMYKQGTKTNIRIQYYLNYIITSNIRLYDHPPF